LLPVLYMAVTHGRQSRLTWYQRTLCAVVGQTRDVALSAVVCGA